METTNGIKILVVDNQPNILEFLEMGLINEGFEVQIAREGITALTISKEFNPHLVILDVLLPDVDGFEVCSMLKEKWNVAIIILTAKDGVEDTVKGFTVGADDYMVKPFSFEELLARIYARIRSQFPILIGNVV